MWTTNIHKNGIVPNVLVNRSHYIIVIKTPDIYVAYVIPT